MRMTRQQSRAYCFFCLLLQWSSLVNAFSPLVMGKSRRTTTTSSALELRLHDDTVVQDMDADNSDGMNMMRSLSSRRGFLLSAAAATAVAVAKPSWAADAVSSTSTCDATVSVWQRGNRLIYLLGTAHISEQSAALAGQLVRDTHPSAVFVELDLRRVAGPLAPPVDQNSGIVSTRLAVDPGASTTGSKVIVPKVVPVSERNGGFLPTTTAASDGASTTSSSSSTSLMMASSSSTAADTTAPASPSKPNWFRRTLTDWGAALVGKAIRGMYNNLGQAGFSPGEEFIVAIKEGQAMGSDIVLGDQDVQITLRRLSQALAVTDLNALANPDSDLERSMKELFGGANPPMPDSSPKSQTESKQELANFVEAMKSRDKVREIMKELKQIAPALVQVMLTERDTYMATGLDSLQDYEIITAVMGLAHQDGVERNLQSFGWKPVALNCTNRRAM